MKKEENLNLIDLGGSAEFSLQDEKNIKSSVEGLAALFYKKVAEKARQKQTILTGAMISDDNFKQVITTQEGSTTLEMFMIYYADFVNKGVKGVKSSKNAPNSPYQFKTLGMPEQARKRLEENISNGKIKISDKFKVVGNIQKYGKEGLEAKSKDTPNQQDINEKEAARMAYLIKAFGIKTTNFLDDAFNEWKKEVGPIIGPAAKAQLISMIKQVNK
jgi:hypothetical protein